VGDTSQREFNWAIFLLLILVALGANRLGRLRPVVLLVAASEHAQLLVVGSRGRGAFTGMLLGSVSYHCLQNAHCPVVVFRGRDDD